MSLDYPFHIKFCISAVEDHIDESMCQYHSMKISDMEIIVGDDQQVKGETVTYSKIISVKDR